MTAAMQRAAVRDIRERGHPIRLGIVTAWPATDASIVENVGRQLDGLRGEWA